MSAGEMRIWNCKIGEVDMKYLPDGADFPMRQAIKAAYREITGQDPQFLFSGWAGQLDDSEREYLKRKYGRES